MAFLKEREREMQLKEQDLEDDEEGDEKEEEEDDLPEHMKGLDLEATKGPSKEETAQNVEEVEEEVSGEEGGIGGISNSLPPPPPPPTEEFTNGDMEVPDLDPSSPAYKGIVHLQAAFRGYSLRSNWMREDAAVMIQSVTRGVLERKKRQEA